MAIEAVKFYLDENLSPEIIRQLQRDGIDIIRGPLGGQDPEHLQLATDMGRVVCTEDRDFLRLAASGIEHAGVVKGEQNKHSMGDWVKYLRLAHAVYTADEMRNDVFHVFVVD